MSLLDTDTSSDNKPHHRHADSIRLSVLNPAVRERVEKFDIGNDGAIDVHEALQGLVTLQKQSNNYKKMIWFLIPVICLVLAGTFGTTILAINLTKDIQQNDGILTSKVSNTPIRTMLADSRDVMYSSMFSEDYNLITRLHVGKNSMDVKSVFQEYVDENNKVVYVMTDMVHFAWNQTGEYAVFYNTGLENNIVAKVAFRDVSFALMRHQKSIEDWKLTFNTQYFTLDDISNLNQIFEVSTSKDVSLNNYEVSDGVISRLAAAAPSKNQCKDNPSYKKMCSSSDNYGCVLKTCSAGQFCWPVSNAAELQAQLKDTNNGQCTTTIDSLGPGFH